MTIDPDPFEQGQRTAREGILAEGNPYQDGTDHCVVGGWPRTGCRRGRG
jgi:hypothetical protein